MLFSAKIRDDLLEGAEAIAAELGWPRRRVYYTIESGSGEWPIWREGGVITSTRSALRQHLAARAQEAMNRTRQSSAGTLNGDCS